MSLAALRWLLAVNALVGLAGGLALLLLPELFLSLLGLHSDQTGLVLARLYGAELVGFNVATWLARSLAAQPGVVLGHVANESLTAAVLWIAIAGGAGGPLLWALAVVATAFAVGLWWAATRRTR